MLGADGRGSKHGDTPAELERTAEQGAGQRGSACETRPKALPSARGPHGAGEDPTQARCSSQTGWASIKVPPWDGLFFLKKSRVC